MAYAAAVLIFGTAGFGMWLSQDSATYYYAAMLINIGAFVAVVHMWIADLMSDASYKTKGVAWLAHTVLGLFQMSLQDHGSGGYIYWLLATGAFALAAYGTFSTPIRSNAT